MTRNDDFIGQVEGYLDEYEGSTPLPGEVRDAIRAQLPSIHQRPAWWPARRFPSMNNTAKLALAAAAVMVAAFLGIRFLLPGEIGIGGPDPTPSPTPSPRALTQGELEAGTYRFTVLGDVSVTATLPDGWRSAGGNLLADNVASPVVVFWPSDAEAGNVYADPCRWQNGFVDPRVGPTVDDLATALANQPQRGDALPVDIVIDGYQGKMVELSVPGDINFADCDDGQFHSWQGRFHQAPGQIDRVYIVDVNGQRLLIDAHFEPGTSEADLAEQQAVMDSIQLDTP